MEKNKNKKILYWLFDILINIAIIFGLVIIIQTWVIAPFDVSGGSMCDTLNNIDDKCVGGYGEKIIINEILYSFSKPKRGDIVVFNVAEKNEENLYYIKRVIGEPGDTIKIENGNVYLKTENSEEFIELQEDYLNETNKGNTEIYYDRNEFLVPEDKYFVLGDNRNASTDSRACFLHSLSKICEENPDKAFVESEKIKGKATIVWWPLKQFHILKNIDYTELEIQKTTP